MSTFDPRHFTKLMNGNYVEKSLLGTVERIYDEFGDKVKVMYLEQPGEGIAEEPWIICEWVEATQSWEKIFGAWEMDDRVLHRLRELDMMGKKAADVIKKIEEAEAKFYGQDREKYDEWRKEEAIPLIAAAFKSDKAYTFKNPETGKIVKLHG